MDHTLNDAHPLCVVAVVGLERLNDLWGYAVVPVMMPDRSKLDSRPRETRGLTPCIGGRGSFPGRVCSSDVPVQAKQRWRNYGTGPHLFKKG